MAVGFSLSLLLADTVRTLLSNVILFYPSRLHPLEEATMYS